MYYQTMPTHTEDVAAKEAIHRLTPHVRRRMAQYRECLRALVLYCKDCDADLVDMHATLDSVLLRESWQAWKESSDSWDYPDTFRGRKQVVADALLQAAQSILAQAYEAAFYGSDGWQANDILLVSEWIAAREFGGYLHWEY